MPLQQMNSQLQKIEFDVQVLELLKDNIEPNVHRLHFVNLVRSIQDDLAELSALINSQEI